MAENANASVGARARVAQACCAGKRLGTAPAVRRACKRVGRRDGPGNAAFSFVNAITARDAPLCERTGEDAVQPAPAPPGSAGRGREEALARESAFTGASLAAR